MAEVVGVISIIASVEAVVEGSILLIQWAHDAWKVNEEKANLRQEIQGSKDILTLLKQREEYARQREKDPRKYPDDEEFFRGLRAVLEDGDPERGGKRGALVRLQQTVDSLLQDLKPSHGFKKHLSSRLKWSYNKTKIKSLQDQLREWREQVKLHLDHDDFSLLLKAHDVIKDVKSDTQELLSKGAEVASQLATLEADRKADQERKERKDRGKLYEAVANWLSPTNLNTRHEEILADCEKLGLGILESAEFKNWREGQPWALHCWADAGTGKTKLCAQIVEYIRMHFQGRNVPVLCIYLDHKEHTSQRFDNVIKSLLKQLILYYNPPSCSEALIDRYKSKPRGSRLNKEESQAAFCREVLQFERVIVVADAIDEGSLELQRFYEDILCSIPWDRLSLLVTSREAPTGPSIDVQCDSCGKKPLIFFYRCQHCSTDLCYECKAKDVKSDDPPHNFEQSGRQVDLYFAPSIEDIRKYVKLGISKQVKAHRPVSAKLGLYEDSKPSTPLGRLCKKDPDLEEKVVTCICDRADGKFKLAQLYLELLTVKYSRKEFDEALARLPKGYTKLYDQQMERIKDLSLREPESSAWEKAKEALSWIVFTHRPLQLRELLHAMGTKPDTGFDEDALYDELDLLRVTDRTVLVGSDEVVRLPHYTLQEYFVGDGRRWLLPHICALMARVTLAYISMPDLSRPFESSSEHKEFESRKAEYPFLSYAYEYWGYHAKEASSDAETHEGVLKVLRSDRLIAIIAQSLWYLESTDSSRWEIRKGASALHLAAWFGLTDIVVSLREDGLFIDAKDPAHKLTPLMIASRRDHSETVTKLLDLGAAVNKSGARGQSAISEALYENHLDVMKVLLAREDLNINQPYLWNFDRTILMAAVSGNKEEMVDLILRAENLKINQIDSTGNTALSIASALGYLSMVKKLLDIDGIDTNVTSMTGYSALTSAAAELQDTDSAKEIVLKLLAHDANRHIREKERGETPAMLAVAKGSINIMKTLLTPGSVDIDETDDQGRSLLHIAVANEHLEIARFLIDKRVDPEKLDSRNRTPLHEAARHGKEESVRFLLSLKVNPSPRDKSNRTPREVARQNGQLSVLPLLESAANTQNQPESEDPPIWSLAKIGCEDMIYERIKLSGRDAIAHDPPDPDTGDTAVHCAINAESGNVSSMLQLLLEAGIPPTIPNDILRTPLHEAASIGNPQLVQTLLQYSPSTSLHAKDKAGFTPLWLAYTYHNTRCALLLIIAGAQIDEKIMLLPLLFTAIEQQNHKAVEMLVETHDAPTQAKNKFGESALQAAKRVGNGEIMQLLVANKSRYVNVSGTLLESPNVLSSPTPIGEEEYLRERVRSPFFRGEAWEGEQQYVESEGEKKERHVVAGPVPNVLGLEGLEKKTEKVMLAA